MHYPVMTERHLADRWQVSLKTLQRWRIENEGPIWHKLFRYVRYHEADILEFESRSAQHLMTLLGINREFKPAAEATQDQDLNAEPESHYLTSKEIAEAASLPLYLFQDQAERSRRSVPHLMLVGNLRFSLDAILQWELANSVPGHVPEPVAPTAAAESEPHPEVPTRVPRWYELVREQDGKRCDSSP